MKIKVGDFRSTRKTKEVDISEFIDPATVEKMGGKVLIELKKLNTKERDEKIANMTQYVEFDQETRRERYAGSEWLHESRVQMLLIGVNKDRKDFPFEKWDKGFLEEIDNSCPELIEYLSDELDELNRPLLPKNSKK